MTDNQISSNQMSFDEFKSKLKPSNIIVTQTGLCIIITEVTVDKVCLCLPTEKSNKQYRMYHYVLYNKCADLKSPWRMLTKEEYIEEFI